MDVETKFYTVQEVADLLKVHWQTVLNYIKSGTLLAVRLGNGYRIDKIDLDRFIEQLKNKGLKKIKK